jgi:hypothetical protein
MGLFHFLFFPSLPAVHLQKDAGAMWQYFGTDFVLDFVKGLVVGGASLAFQVLAPRAFRALKRFRAHWSARKPARHWFVRNPARKPERTK